MVAELESINCLKFPDIFAEVSSNKTLNKKDETQVNIKDLDAAIMFSTNVMNEQTENNKQTNFFLKIFIRKPISLPLKAIHVTLTGSKGSVSTSKICWALGKNEH